MIGNHLPRQCGIATFTTDLSDALTAAFSGLDCFVLAMNDAKKPHKYPARVHFEIEEDDLGSYGRAADFLNSEGVDVVSVQHEYGIFGGPAGSHVLDLLRELHAPIVTTLHTILVDPNPAQRKTMDELSRLSDRLVVMSRRGAMLLREVHGVPMAKIDMIPHGIPEIRSSHLAKNRLGFDKKFILLTFGLLSPDKGIEHVIDAMPEILARCPETVYIVLGATHPHIKERHGETYRCMLEQRAKDLKVDSHIIFRNQFVGRDELELFLSAADIYITPYLKPEQITSGTLAYAIGSGKAVISTPYSYARELLADDCGLLVPWRDSGSIAREVIGLFRDDNKRLTLQRRAAGHGRAMKWPVVAASYMRSFDRARSERRDRAKPVLRAHLRGEHEKELPRANLEHLRLMTDDTGMFQHAAYGIPCYEDGYCLDDNSRALLLMVSLGEGGARQSRNSDALGSRYLAFVNHSFNAKLGRFRNFMTHARQWMEDCGSEDSHGRAIWALGTLAGRSADGGRRQLGARLLHNALPALASFTSPRAWAFALLGIDECLRLSPDDDGLHSTRRALSAKLLDLFRRTSRPEWQWFEESLTYCNPHLSQALVASGAAMGDQAMMESGLASLRWLASVQFSGDGCFVPIGSNGFYPSDGQKACFDQQPVEAYAMVSACLQSMRATGDERWADLASRAFQWFLGENVLGLSLYDPSTGGCRDGLHPERANENQGAESTLSFLLALSEIRADARARTRPTAARAAAE